MIPNVISSHTGFQHLEEMWLGGTYPVEFYQHLDNEIEDALCQITEFTNETLDELETVLLEHRVEVHRPRFESDSSLYRDKNDNLIKPPIAPRDWALTLGNTLYIFPMGYQHFPYQDALEQYNNHNADVRMLKRSSDIECWLDFPCLVRIGKDLFYDAWLVKDDQTRMDMTVKALQKFTNDYRIHITMFGGHSDSIFCPVKENLIFSSHYGDTKIYDKTFPDWKVFMANDSSYIKRLTEQEYNFAERHWFVEDNNFESPIFNSYIEKHAKDWTGNAYETVFDVNMIVINETNVICETKDDRVLEFFEQNGITPHVVKSKAKGFWDSGHHCMSVDIRRAGDKKDYFTKRDFPFFKTHK